MKIGILEPNHFPLNRIADLAKLGEVTLFDGRDLAGFLADKTILIVRLAHRVDKRFLLMAPRLKIIASATTGITHIDGKALKDSGVQLISLQKSTHLMGDIRATPEMTMCLILAVLRRLPNSISSVMNGEWDRTPHIGRELFGLRVGVIGLGRVGRQLCQYLRAFGAEIFWYDPLISGNNQSGTRIDDLHELLKISELIVISASFKPGQSVVIGGPEIALLHGKYLVNTARGELVDEEGLIGAASAGQLAGVALDVLESEPHPTNLRKWLSVASDPSSNIILTPHVAGYTKESIAKAESLLIDLLANHLEHQHDWN